MVAGLTRNAIDAVGCLYVDLSAGYRDQFAVIDVTAVT